jgi:hypothetical protein
MQYIGCIGESPGVSESAGGEFRFCTLSAPPLTYTFKIIRSSSNRAGAARESPSCGRMVSTPKFATFRHNWLGQLESLNTGLGASEAERPCLRSLVDLSYWWKTIRNLSFLLSVPLPCVQSSFVH